MKYAQTCQKMIGSATSEAEVDGDPERGREALDGREVDQVPVLAPAASSSSQSIRCVWITNPTTAPTTTAPMTMKMR